MDVPTNGHFPPLMLLGQLRGVDLKYTINLGYYNTK